MIVLYLILVLCSNNFSNEQLAMVILRYCNYTQLCEFYNLIYIIFAGWASFFNAHTHSQDPRPHLCETL